MAKISELDPGVFNSAFTGIQRLIRAKCRQKARGQADLMWAGAMSDTRVSIPNMSRAVGVHYLELLNLVAKLRM